MKNISMVTFSHSIRQLTSQGCTGGIFALVINHRTADKQNHLSRRRMHCRNSCWRAAIEQWHTLKRRDEMENAVGAQ